MGLTANTRARTSAAEPVAQFGDVTRDCGVEALPEREVRRSEVDAVHELRGPRDGRAGVGMHLDDDSIAAQVRASLGHPRLERGLRSDPTELPDAQ